MRELLTLLSLLLRTFTLYFALVAVFTLLRRRPFPAAEPATRFAVLAAARNEEAVIGQLVESLRAQRYPPELVDIYVIPNNCTDDTAGAAAAAGARVLTCRRPVHSKGEALGEAFRQLAGEGYDAYAVFDADNVADPDFLARMNDAFQGGAALCKGRIRAANPRESWVAGAYALYFSSFDWFFSRPRGNCGLSAKLVGTGFALRRSVLEELGGWHTGTIAEDAELAAQCAAAGYRVAWVPEAVTYDEEPLDLGTSLIQRKRWCSGIMQVARKELGNLLRGKGPLPLRLDMAMFLTAPYAQAISALLLGVEMVLAGPACLPALLLTLGAAYAGAALVGLAMCLADGYGLKGMVPAILGYPIFMATWLPLQVAALFRDTRRWREIPHRGVGTRLAEGGK